MKDSVNNKDKSYGAMTATAARWVLKALAAAILLNAMPACAQTGNDAVLEAREALRKKDRARLAALRDSAIAERNPLAMWIDYWEIGQRLQFVQADEIAAFYQRWRGTYVEDRLRNDWLLELGRRRDFKALAADFPSFRMNDDREVSCYALLADHLGGKDVRSAARSAWFAQREADDGCALLAATLYDAKQLTEADAWRKARLAIDGNKPRAARQAALMVNTRSASDVDDLADNPARYLTRALGGRQANQLNTLALMRLASTDPELAANLLNGKWEAALPPELAAWAWAAVGKQAALKLLPEASGYFTRAALLSAKSSTSIDWADETLAWKARAALRAGENAPRWQQVVQAIDAMNPVEQRDATWVYWKARALRALAKESTEGDGLRAQATEMFEGIASQFGFYGMLAAEELGRPITLPIAPQPLTQDERDAAARQPGLARALTLVSIGLRSEGVREWNFTLRGMEERELLASAQLACDRHVWDRCVNTSDRTRGEIDIAQRYPTPFRAEVMAASKTTAVDPALIYGVMRQESRFQPDIRSSANAYGLMQVIQPTAKNVAKRIGMAYDPAQIMDVPTNVQLGSSYLRLLLDDFGGSQVLSATAYNAGPGRPRRWREGPKLEPAIWIENIPFNETRDYVKKVMANTLLYATLLNDPTALQTASLKARLGKPVGPREPTAPPPDTNLP